MYPLITKENCLTTIKDARKKIRNSSNCNLQLSCDSWHKTDKKTIINKFIFFFFVRTQYLYSFNALARHLVPILLYSTIEMKFFITIAFNFLAISPILTIASPSSNQRAATSKSFADVVKVISPYHVDAYDIAGAKADILSKTLTIFNLPEAIVKDLNQYFDTNSLKAPEITEITKDTEERWKSIGGDINDLITLSKLHKYKIFNSRIISQSVDAEHKKTNKSVQQLLMGPGEKACQPFQNELKRWQNPKECPDQAKFEALKAFIFKMSANYEEKINELKLKLQKIEEFKDLVRKLNQLHAIWRELHSLETAKGNDFKLLKFSKLASYRTKVNDLAKIDIDIEIILLSLREVNKVVEELCQIRIQILQKFPEIMK